MPDSFNKSVSHKNTASCTIFDFFNMSLLVFKDVNTVFKAGATHFFYLVVVVLGFSKFFGTFILTT